MVVQRVLYCQFYYKIFFPSCVDPKMINHVIFLVLSLNLPTMQDYAQCCLFGIFKVANEIENQSALSGTQS